jgi:cell division protein FtsQ
LPSAKIGAPRFVRKTKRFASRVMAGETRLPRFAMTITTAALLGSFGAYGVLAGGHGSVVLETASSALGFAVTDVTVKGGGETSEIDVLGQLGLDGSTSMIGFDVEAARQRIVELPWVKDATVSKVYPDTIVVKLVERKAFAIWQHDDQLTLVDRSGTPIVAFTEAKYAGLPLVVGAGASEKAESLIALVHSHPDIAGKVKGYIRIADRRWDLRLENGITIRLPEKNAGGALDQLTRLDNQYGLLSRDIETVDLRDSERLVLKLAPEAAKERKAAIKRLMEHGRKGGDA